MRNTGKTDSSKSAPLTSNNPILERIYRIVLGRDRLNRSDALHGYLFCIPWIVGFAVLTIGPFVVSLVMSFFEWRGYGPPQFVGTYNYEWMFGGDKLFGQALTVSSTYAALVVPSTVVFAFLLAWILAKDRPGVKMFRAIFYLPSVVTGAALAFVWLFVFNPRSPVSHFTQWLFGLEQPVKWLSTPSLVVPAFSIMQVWVLGPMFIVLLGAIKGIPRTYYEVATIDGAGMWHKLWYVTLPMISPSLFYVVVLTTIRAFQEVTGPLIIFTTSSYAGPLNAGLFYTKYLYQVAFLDGRMGYASALAWVLFAILLVLTTINFVVIGRRVYYGE